MRTTVHPATERDLRSVADLLAADLGDTARVAVLDFGDIWTAPTRNA